MPHDLLDMSDANHQHKQCFARNMKLVETHDLSRYATSSLSWRSRHFAVYRRQFPVEREGT